jgi:hypothetical protein
VLYLEDDRERNSWIEFIKEIKNTQLNKWNASSVKIWALVTFLASGIIFLINNIDNVININSIVVILSFLFGISNVGFLILNTFFRKELVYENVSHKYNELKKQIMSPVIFATHMIAISCLISNIFATRYIIYNKEYDVSSGPQVIYIINIMWLEINTFGINKMIQKMLLKLNLKDRIKIMEKISNVSSKKKNTQQITSIVMIIILLVISLFQFYQLYKTGFFIKNKKSIIYSLYIFGFLGSGVWIAKYYSYKIIYTWIEDFYSEIFKHNLSTQEMKNKYFNEFASNNSLENFAFRKKE